jgi:Ni,Fe-hydrogenase III component G
LAVAPVNRQYGLLIDRIIVSVDPECILLLKIPANGCSVDDRSFHASKGERETVFLVTLIFLKEDSMRFLVLWPCIRYPNRMLPSQIDVMP